MSTRLHGQITSDQGREFVKKVIDNLMDHFQTDHCIALAYHPQSNGQRERDNRTLKAALITLVHDQANDWDQYISGILFAYHTSIHVEVHALRSDVWPHCQAAH